MNNTKPQQKALHLREYVRSRSHSKTLSCTHKTLDLLAFIHPLLLYALVLPPLINMLDSTRVGPWISESQSLPNC